MTGVQTCALPIYLYVMQLADKSVKQLTTFQDFDVKFPSLGDKAIAFEQAGYIWKLDLETHKVEKIRIELKEDFSFARTSLTPVGSQIAGASASPDGKRVAFTARGELFSVPNGPGITRNLSQSTSAHERDPHWSPDGKNIAYISDKSGEDEIYMIAPDGKSSAVQLTKGGDVYKYSLTWSPDSKKIL